MKNSELTFVGVLAIIAGALVVALVVYALGRRREPPEQDRAQQT
jgi:hypothetical protein